MAQSINKSKNEVYELFMLVLCVYVLAALVATTFLRLDQMVVEILDYVDTAVCLVFMADFFMKLFTAQDKLEYLKWGWIDFLSRIPAVGPLRWGRFARIVRILRLLRGVRSCKILFEFLLRRRAESLHPPRVGFDARPLSLEAASPVRIELNGDDGSVMRPVLVQLAVTFQQLREHPRPVVIETAQQDVMMGALHY